MRTSEVYASRGRSAPGGFTMTELMIVIGIIVILVSMFAGVAGLSDSGKRQKTKALLTKLAAIAQAYEAKTRREVDREEPRLDPQLPGPAADLDFYIGVFAEHVRGVPGPDQMLNSISLQNYDGGEPDPKITDDAGEPTIIDAWGNNIRYVPFNRNEDDPDRRNYTETDELPNYSRPFFASAGPDGQWGNVRFFERLLAGQSVADLDLPQARLAKDNLYSFDTRSEREIE